MSAQKQPASGGVRVACVLLMATIFALDVKTPLGVAAGILYVAVVLTCLWSHGRHDTIIAAGLCSVLAILGYHFSPPAPAGGVSWQALANLGFALFAIWVTALLVVRRKEDLCEHERRLHEQMDELVKLTRSQSLGQGDLEAALREITETAARVLHTRRVGVWLFSGDRSRLRCVEQYDGSSGEHTKGGALEARKYPAYFAALETERTISATDAARDPRTREFTESYLQPHGITSMLDAPIRLRGRTAGVVCHEHVGTRRAWTVEEQNFAGSVADFVDLAVEASERKRAEDQLRAHRDHLEEQVAQRTSELQQVNERLRGEIEDRRRAVEAYKESEQRYRLLIENLPVGIYRNTPGPKGRFLMANPAHARMMGYDSLAEFLKTSVAERYVRPAERMAFLEKLLAQGKVFEEVLRLKRRDGSHMWAAVTAQVVYDASGAVSHIDGVIEDITERKEAEEKVAWQTRELARSNRELERFAYAVSHDLQEPLRAVTGHCQLLQRRYQGKLGPEADEFIAQAVDGATRMKDLIDGLLAYSRVGTQGAMIQATDGEHVLRTALANLKTQIGDTAATIDHDPLPTVMADATQLVVLLQNLISNAIKYHGPQPPSIHIGVGQEAGQWVFSVRDNGIGIAPEHQKRIFAIFQRLHTREEYPGAGIGLAICKKIVESLGGKIWVESAPGQGSTFFFSLPTNVPGSARSEEEGIAR